MVEQGGLLGLPCQMGVLVVELPRNGTSSLLRGQLKLLSTEHLGDVDVAKVGVDCGLDDTSSDGDGVPLALGEVATVVVSCWLN